MSGWQNVRWNSLCAIEEFVGFIKMFCWIRMYSHLVNHNSEHNKTKGVNRNVVATISYNEYRDVLLNKKCLRHSNRSQNTNWFIFLALLYQKSGCDGLSLGY